MRDLGVSYAINVKTDNPELFLGNMGEILIIIESNGDEEPISSLNGDFTNVI